MDMLGDALQGATLLDLFAGTGALGLEAISRGASSCDFVEFRPDSLHALKANVAALGLQGRTRIFKKDAIPFAEALAEGSYKICFADPPYESKMLDRVMACWKQSRFSRILVLEHAKSHDVPKGTKRKVIEDTVVTIYVV